MPRTTDVRIEGLNPLLRALRKFPDEAQAELKRESKAIASQVMVPAYLDAARGVPKWGSILAEGIKAKTDRIPAVNIGYVNPKHRGGAGSMMLRYPTTTGDGGDSTAPFVRTNWMDRAKGYKGKAMEKWGDALARVVTEWNRGA
jgi:hypothetical protein